MKSPCTLVLLAMVAIAFALGLFVTVDSKNNQTASSNDAMNNVTPARSSETEMPTMDDMFRDNAEHISVTTTMRPVPGPSVSLTDSPAYEPQDISTIPNVTVDMKNILDVLARVMPSIDTMPFESIDSPQNSALKWLAEDDSIIQYPLPGPDDILMPEYSISVNDGIEIEVGENNAMTMEGGQNNGMMMVEGGMIELNNAYINTRRLVERYALAVFFFSTTTDDGDMTNWLDGNEDACSWYGITCEYYPPMEGEDMMNGDMSMKVITEIELVNNGLQGTIPSELVLLQSLETLSLDANELEGSVPESLGRLPNLSFLKIDNNMLTGEVPDSLCMLQANEVLKDLIATCGDGGTGGLECDCCTECIDSVDTVSMNQTDG